MTHNRVFRWMISALVIVGVVVAIRVFEGSDTVQRNGLTFASDDLAEAVERNVHTPGMRVIVAFRDVAGVPCRAFLATGTSGIACNERGGWHLRVVRGGVSVDDPAAVAATETALRKAAAQMTAQ